MFKKIFILIVLWAFNSPVFAQNHKADSLAIRNVLVDFFEVFTNPDMKYFDRNCSPEFQLLENGEIWARKEIDNYVKQVLSKEKNWIRTNEFELVQCTIKGKFAWVNYKNTATIKSKNADTENKIKWLESIILEKKKNQWKLLQMHSTPMK